MAQSQEDGYTSIPVRESTRDLLREAKPFESMSYDELLRTEFRESETDQAGA